MPRTIGDELRRPDPYPVSSAWSEGAAARDKTRLASEVSRLRRERDALADLLLRARSYRYAQGGNCRYPPSLGAEIDDLLAKIEEE